MPAAFDEWTQGRTIASIGTNTGAPALPFQSWRKFKEAFAPELIARAVSESLIPVRRCLDPFGGSGTTALACQFLGVHPVTIEVNPFLADLIEAKVTIYDTDVLARDLSKIVQYAGGKSGTPEITFKAAPSTFIEPGVKSRWIFDRAIAARLAAYRTAIEELKNETHRRLFRVLLGGSLVEVSNVVVSGKGRRYRGGWEHRRRSPHTIDQLFCNVAQRAITEIHLFQERPCTSSEVLRGDCREILRNNVQCDVAVFSPPYPNSFDYTDVYNLELWMLGYLNGKEDNQVLRTSTLSSHVQIARAFSPAPVGSETLNNTLAQLKDVREHLWSDWIPEMVGAYFADIFAVLSNIFNSLTLHGQTWMVVGDSCYADVRIATAKIIAELASSGGWTVTFIEPFRAMRASPQQGGRPELAESLVLLTKN